jgi:hypothetical protein
MLFNFFLVLKNAESGVYQQVGALLKRRPELLVITNEEGVQKVTTGKFVFIKVTSYFVLILIM